MRKTLILDFNRIFELLKEGLKPYLLDSYKGAYGNAYLEEIRETIRSFNNVPTVTDDALLSSLDTQACLDLILKRKHLFESRLGHTGIAYASELMDYRIKWAHEKSLRDMDTYRAADTVARLFEIIGVDELAVESHKFATDLLVRFYEEFRKEKESRAFSKQVKAQMALLNRAIEFLTRDQFQIIQWLRGQQKAAISGCAGSGKTLVAVEKAVRLDRAGFRTLVLCHNPQLSDHLARLTFGTGVRVFDFVSWIDHLLNKKVENSPNWTRYTEPPEQDLNDAFDTLADSPEKYDAVIVDEGQDFRDEWWLIVQAALLNPHSGILYIFYDDNQSLLPSRSRYPIEASPFNLSKNCRNAGEIFEEVKRFHPQAPDPSIFLAGRGIYNQTVFPQGEEIAAMNDAVCNSLKLLHPSRLIILTTEPDPAQMSTLNGMVINQKKRKWQDTVYWVLGKTELRLSEMLLPTEDDINAVVSLAQSRKKKGFETKLMESRHARYYAKWSITNRGLQVYTRKGYNRRALLLAFFSLNSWGSGIRIIPEIKISADNCLDSNPSIIQISLRTVASFKGLEADAVILFVRGLQDELQANLYVGMSRAKFLLHLVIDSQTFHHIPMFGEIEIRTKDVAVH